MEEKRTRHQKVWSWSSGKRIEIPEMRIKWNFKGITLPFIPDKNTCHNGGSKNCITGILFPMIIFYISYRDVTWWEKQTGGQWNTLPLSSLNHYLRQHRIWILELFTFSSCFNSSVLSLPLFYYKKSPTKMRRNTTAFKLQLYSQTRQTDLIDVCNSEPESLSSKAYFTLYI